MTGYDTSLTQSLLRELLGLAEKVGETRGVVRQHDLRLTALEQARTAPPQASASSVPTATPGLMAQAKAFAKRLSVRVENMSLWAKIGLWLTPRGLLAWGAWQGWNQTVLGWVQRIVDFW